MSRRRRRLLLSTFPILIETPTAKPFFSYQCVGWSVNQGAPPPDLLKSNASVFLLFFIVTLLRITTLVAERTLLKKLGDNFAAALEASRRETRETDTKAGRSAKISPGLSSEGESDLRQQLAEDQHNLQVESDPQAADEQDDPQRRNTLRATVAFKTIFRASSGATGFFTKRKVTSRLQVPIDVLNGTVDVFHEASPIFLLTSFTVSVSVVCYGLQLLINTVYAKGVTVSVAEGR